MKPFTIISRRRGILLGVVVAAAGAAIAGAALGQTADSGTYVPEAGVTLPSDKAAALEQSLPPGASESSQTGEPSSSQSTGTQSDETTQSPSSESDKMPAATTDVGADTQVPISPEVLVPTNAWSTSDGVTLVAVYAGASGQDKSSGRLVILRQNFKDGSQELNSVDVKGTGAVTITSAPSGAAAETSSQRGDLDFLGEDGTQGTLHLADDTVSVN